VFARLATYDIPEDRQAEARAGFGQAIRRIREVPGLQDAYFLLATEGGRAVTVTFWESREAMAASRVAASRLRGDASAAVDGAVVSVDEFEVVADAG
jgi:heme-degrading monooxygenase HmoA